MKTKWVLFLLMIVMLLLAACRRPASTTPSPTPAPATPPEGGFPLPGTQSTDVMDQLALFATQTAQAAQAQGQLVPTLVLPTPLTQVAGATPEIIPTLQPTIIVQVQPTSPPPQPVEVPKFEVPKRYTLQKGEYIYCIARRFNVNPSELLSLNGLGTNQTVYPGTRLNIPQSGSFPGQRSLRKHPANYTVAAGDTIYSIACLFGDVDPRAIAAVNGLQEPYSVRAGQKLEIP